MRDIQYIMIKNNILFNGSLSQSISEQFTHNHSKMLETSITWNVRRSCHFVCHHRLGCLQCMLAQNKFGLTAL